MVQAAQLEPLELLEALAERLEQRAGLAEQQAQTEQAEVQVRTALLQLALRSLLQVRRKVSMAPYSRKSGQNYLGRLQTCRCVFRSTIRRRLPR